MSNNIEGAVQTPPSAKGMHNNFSHLKSYNKSLQG
jgi:hypothetical protein